MMETFFDALGFCCRIHGEEHLLRTLLDDPFTYHYMIGAQKTSLRSREVDVEVIQDDSLPPKDPVDIHYPTARFNGVLSSRDIVVVAEYLLERARQEKRGWYNISSACASKDGKAVTFYGGATNLGKTSSMLTL